MALNIFGALGAIGRLLPGYIQGERQAVADNWNDLNQYNTVQHGQMSNALDEAMYNPRLSMGYDAAARSRLGYHDAMMGSMLNRAMFPGAMADAALRSAAAPMMTTQNIGTTMSQADATRRYYDWLRTQNPGQQMYGGAGAYPTLGGVASAGLAGGSVDQQLQQIQQQIQQLQQMAQTLQAQRGTTIATPSMLTQ